MLYWPFEGKHYYVVMHLVAQSTHSIWSRNKKNHGWEQPYREYLQKIRKQSLFSIEYSGLMQTYKEILWINIFVLTSSFQKLTINRSSRLYYMYILASFYFAPIIQKQIEIKGLNMQGLFFWYLL